MFIYLVLVVASLAVYWIRKRYSYWKDRDVPFVEPSFPMGSISGVGRKKHLAIVLQQCYNQLKGKGQFGGIFFFTSPVALALDLDFVKTMLVKDFQFFHDRNFYCNEKDDPLSANLLAIKGTEWKHMRNKLTPSFTSGKMKMMFPIITDVAEQFRKILEQECAKDVAIDMKDILARFTTDVIGSCAFGLECNSLHEPESIFRRMGRKVFDQPASGVLKFFLAQQFSNVARKLGVVIIDPEVSQFFLKTVQDTIEYREKNKIERNDFMNLLIKLKNAETLEDGIKDSSEGITIEQAAAQAFVFFAAGFETSSTTMSFCLYELALNLELQEKVRNDIFQTIEKHGSMSYEAIHDMQYLGNCINESLRKYPPIPFLGRAVSKDYNVPGTNITLTKGSDVIVPVYAIHHDAEYYPEPERYDPDRFLPEEVAKRNPYAFLPFGEGPRNCIGLRFGVMQTRVGLAYLLKEFRITVSSRTVMPLKFSPNQGLLVFEGGLWLNIEKLS